MIEQHIIYWLCASLRSSQLIQVLGAFGGFAAPIFITLSGLGATLASYRYETFDRLVITRGIGILCFGYLLNILAPNWFAFESWYVLHIIGFGMLLFPVLKRFSSPHLVILLIIVLIATVVIQTSCKIPLSLHNKHMSDPNLLLGFLQYALVKGYFPIFPWISFFIAGVLSGRWFMEKKIKNVLRLAMILLFSSAILSAVYFIGPEFAIRGVFVRVFRVGPTFYPSLMPMSTFLISTALFFILGFVFLGSRINFKSSNLLVCLGRLSLTFLMIHIVIIRESAIRFHFWRSFSTLDTLLFTLAILIVFSFLALFWRRIEFRFGAEWLLRKISG